MKIPNYQPKTIDAVRGWLIEEMAEVTQAIAKDMRFPGGSYPDGTTNEQKIDMEIDDLFAALEAYRKFIRKGEPRK